MRCFQARALPALAVSVFALLTLSACMSEGPPPPMQASSYWKPISWPNMDMPPQERQTKLLYDLKQCDCGSFPPGAITPNGEPSSYPGDNNYNPAIQPSARTPHKQCAGGAPLDEFSACMRSRGWERTACAGRPGVHDAGGTCYP
jgi:hypothetical protein